MGRGLKLDLATQGLGVGITIMRFSESQRGKNRDDSDSIFEKFGFFRDPTKPDFFRFELNLISSLEFGRSNERDETSWVEGESKLYGNGRQKFKVRLLLDATPSKNEMK